MNLHFIYFGVHVANNVTVAEASVYCIVGKFGKFAHFEKLVKKVWQMNRFSQK